MSPRGFGRKPFVADKRDWPVEKLKAMIERGEAIPLAWSVTSILDQGDTPECVAFGTLGALNCDDEEHNNPGFTNLNAHLFFETIPGAGPDGAYVRDGLKAAKAAGYISAYSLLTTEAEIRDWLENHGSIILGTDWLSGMDAPDVKGYVLVSGEVRGGHCYYANGDIAGYDFVNSWGEEWAYNGHFYMSAIQFRKLMRGDFEAWAVVQPVPAPPRPPVPPQPPEDGLLVRFLRALVAFIQKFLDDVAGAE